LVKAVGCGWLWSGEEKETEQKDNKQTNEQTDKQVYRYASKLYAYMCLVILGKFV